jgi:hypothetical protein
MATAFVIARPVSKLPAGGGVCCVKSERPVEGCCSPRFAEVNPGVQLSAAVRLVITVVRWSMPQTCPKDPDSGLQPYVL